MSWRVLRDEQPGFTPGQDVFHRPEAVSRHRRQHDDVELLGCSHGFLDDAQLKAPMDTTIITLSSVERRSLPPALTLMTDSPITAQPAMPPLKPLAMLATP